MFSVAPVNHLANGASDQSQTWSHFFRHLIRSAYFAQKASRSLASS